MAKVMTTRVDDASGRLTGAVDRLRVHDHSCLIYETREEQFAAVIPFMHVGLTAGEKCVYIADENTSSVVIAAMQAAGIDTGAALKSGALSIITKSEAYIKDGCFDPDVMIRYLSETIAVAKAEGFTALRATAEMTLALGSEVGGERLLEYELKLNPFVRNNDIVAICQFNRSRFSAEIIRDIILSHPLVIHGEKVCRNFYFVPPHELAASGDVWRGVDRMLRNLREHGKSEEVLREREEYLDQLMSTIGDAVFTVRLPERRIEYVNQVATAVLGYLREEMIGRAPGMLFAGDADYGAFDQILQDAWEQGREEFRAELELQRKDGQPFWGEVHSSLRLREGQPSVVINVVRDVTERKRAENERQAHLWLLESMDLVDRAIRGANDLEQMMRDVLDVVLAIFGCDRAWLVYPADPEAPSFFVPMERTRPEYPGAFIQKVQVPMDPDSARVIRTVMDSGVPVPFGPGSEHPLNEDVAKRFGIQSQIIMGVYPNIDKPYVFGLHQCSYPRVWTPEERRLFQEIGRRLADGLTSLLAYRELQESEARYRRITEGLTDYQYSVRIENGHAVETRHSPACAKVTGYTAEEFTADPYLWIRMVAPQDRQLVQERMEQLLAGEDIPPIEHRILLKDGTLRWVCDTTIPLKDASGRLLSYDGVIKDITERKQAFEALREREAFIRNILDSVDEGFIVVDRNFSILSASRSFIKLMQSSEDQVVGRPCYEVTRHGKRACFEHGEDCAVRRTFETGTDQFASHMQTDPSDVEHYVEIKSYPIIDASGTVTSAIVTVNDMTEKRRLEEQLMQAQKMEAVGRLAGGVAHEYNNMLSIILGHADLALLTMEPDEPLCSGLQEIRKAAERSAALTQQLLGFARRQTVAPKVLDLNQTVEKTLGMLRRLIGNNVELTWLPGAQLWPVHIDPSQIDQVLANLCANARDAISDTGKITIETDTVILDEAYCAAHPGFNAGEYVALTVSDDGCGMDQVTLSNLFEPFFTTKEIGKGTGLGLATVYGIVKQNHGFIEVSSESGHGTTFKLYLPRYGDGAKATGKDSPAAMSGEGPETILLVEDDFNLLNLGKRMLERLGYRVLAASTPGEAILMAGEYAGKIHLLMTDVIMPEMNGRDLARDLTALYPKLKCLFMSGYTRDVIGSNGLLNEEVHFIQKPFSMKSVAAKVREVLDSP